MNYEVRTTVISVSSIIATVIVVCTLINWGLTAVNNDHDFDVKCIQSGKSLTYEAVPGESYAKKVCK